MREVWMTNSYTRKERNHPMLKLVIFDMDGLMFDTEGVMCRAFLEVTRENGYPGSRDQFMSLIGLNGPDIQEKYRQYFGRDVDAAGLYRMGGQRKIDIIREEGIPVKQGLFELLSEVDRLGLKKAVASSSDEEMIRDNLARAGLSDHFDLILSTRDFKRGKPFPDIFLTVCQRLDVLPDQALVLEDSPSGVEAAIAAGIDVIQIPDLIDLPPSLEKKCYAVCESLDQVIPLLEPMTRPEQS